MSRSALLIASIALMIFLCSAVNYPTSFYGYVPIGSASSQMFYQLIPLQTGNPKTAPLVIWLQGTCDRDSQPRRFSSSRSFASVPSHSGGPGGSSQFGNWDGKQDK